MKSTAAIAIACLSIPGISLAATSDLPVTWSALSNFDLGTPNPRLSDSAKDHWVDAQWRRAMGKPGTHIFKGYSRITKVEEKKGKWEITAVKARTPDQELRHEAAVIRGGLMVNEPTPTLSWIEDKRPEISSGTKIVITGTLMGAKWSDSRMLMVLKDVTTEELHDQ